MKREEVFEGLNEVFQDVFDDDTIEVQENTTSDDIEDWDSFEHINLIVAIEKKFHIKFKMGEVSKLKDVSEMVDLILARVS